MISRLCSSALLGAALLLAPRFAQAGPGDATRLEYARGDRAASCPDREALREAVTKRLGYDPFFPVARQAIVVQITYVDDNLHAQLRLLDENGIIRGSRELRERPEHCDELVASLALAISIALDPSAAFETPPATDVPVAATAPAAQKSPAQHDEEPSTEPAKVSSIVPARSPAPRPTTTPGAPDTTAATVRAGAFAALGSAPALGFGFRLGAGLRRGWFALSAEFADQLPASRAIAGGGRAQGSLVGATLAPCFVHGWAAACALVSAGSLSTEGEGVASPLRQRTPQVSLGARLEYAPALSHTLRLLVNLDALKPLIPVTLRLRQQEVWHAPALNGAVGLGLEVQFP